MSPQVLHVATDIPARYALSLMARRSVSCVVVMENDRPAGMFTERDVVRCVAKGIDLSAVSVGSVMSPTIVSTSSTAPPHDTIGLMLKKSIRRLLVVDELGAMAGILTQTDIGRVLDRKEPGLINRLLGGTTPSAEVPQGAA